MKGMKGWVATLAVGVGLLAVPASARAGRTSFPRVRPAVSLRQWRGGRQRRAVAGS